MVPGAATPAAVRAVGWGWRHAGRRSWAIDGLDLAVEPGERVLLLGASGSGKSTLLHGLAGVLGGEEEGDALGSLLVGGRPASAGSAALVLQDPDAQVVLARVGDDVAFGCENAGVPREQIWPRVREALDAVGLDLPLDHPTSHLSGGQKQRLALAGALAMRPGLLLLDEPTANLDPAGVREVRDAVERVTRESGATLVVVEHRVDAWLPVIDRVVVLGAGGVVADGPPEAVLAERAEELARDGIWLPGRRLLPDHVPSAQGPVLLDAAGLAVGRDPSASVLGGLDLAVRSGNATCVTGPNGIGKSTLALTLAGLIPPVAGRLEASAALARGANPAPHRWRSKQLLSRIGTVFQDPEHQFLTGRVRDELAVGPRGQKVPDGEIRERVDDLLVRLRLDRLAEANPYTLSGGQKRRLSVATVLASRPDVLVLDEPTFGQDATTWAELVALLGVLRDEGHAIVAVTHDEHVVDALADLRLDLAHEGVPA
ncbi:ABC transporter ATP-binding protein [Agromyces rhizosphaerae]|uniref:ABC transporter ATP-binding protein n=1 Tax=Agromyces rhizosphaerae TaxID=88374 RepID=A0A9W6CZ84_9MICO|nr:ABC transporter ATP-binding protein [Agromyces rhizosphaerae]